MKASGFLWILVLLIATLSCSKDDVRPTVYITVVDSLDRRLPNARVLTHPCLDGVSCDTTRLNTDFIYQDYTDANGQLVLTFPYSAIIDVSAQWTNCDTPDNWCMYVGQTVARFETKRQDPDDPNDYDVKVVVLDR